MPRKKVPGPQAPTWDPADEQKRCVLDTAARASAEQVPLGVGGDVVCPGLPEGDAPRRILHHTEQQPSDRSKFVRVTERDLYLTSAYPNTEHDLFSTGEGEQLSSGCVNADGVDEQEGRARELERLGYFRRAVRVRDCGMDRLNVWWCGDRQCPRCSRRRARIAYETFLEVVMDWGTVGFWTLTLPSEGPWRLREGLKEMRKCLNAWRRYRSVREGVLGVVGSIEPKCSKALWSVHAHLVVEEDEKSISYPPIRKAWEEVTGGNGRLLIESEPLRSVERVTSYSVKMRDECPEPGTMRIERYAHLVKGVKGARLKVAWGSGYTR